MRPLTLEAETATATAPDLSAAIAEFQRFGYQDRPYAARNWGHPMHSLCSYPSKIKPGLAHFLVKCFTEPGDRVLDPFCGVGTIPFEACLQGRAGLGTDLSPFAVTVAAAKVRPPSPNELMTALSEFEGELQERARSVDLGPVEEEIRSFFHDETCREVVAAQDLLIDTAFGARPAGRAITAALCHVLHGNRPYALSRRSHGIIPIPPKGEFTYKSVAKAVRDKLARAKLDQLPPTFTTGSASQADAFSLPFEDAAADAILTSPPFLGTTEFLRQNRVRLWFCGMSYERQLTTKSDFVEHRRGLDHYLDLLQEWHRILRPGGTLVMHLGVVKERDMAREIQPHADSAGFDVAAVLYEPVPHLESHGRTDRGGTHTHQFLVATSALTSAG